MWLRHVAAYKQHFFPTWCWMLSVFWHVMLYQKCANKHLIMWCAACPAIATSVATWLCQQHCRVAGDYWKLHTATWLGCYVVSCLVYRNCYLQYVASLADPISYDQHSRMSCTCDCRYSTRARPLLALLVAAVMVLHFWVHAWPHNWILCTQISGKIGFCLHKYSFHLGAHACQQTAYVVFQEEEEFISSW